MADEPKDEGEKLTGLQRKKANLKPFVKGQSGNPSGKRKGTINLKRLLLEELEKADEAAARLHIRSLIASANEGNGVAIKTIWDRIDGPVKEEAQIEIVDSLSDEERAARTLALLERARARRTGSAAEDSESD